MIVIVDGGPDGHPRYIKTNECAIDYFNTYDLDAFLLATNAPGLVKFSKEFSGIILPHDQFSLMTNSERTFLATGKQ